MQCGNCHKDIPNESLFCNFCGTKVAEPAKLADAANEQAAADIQTAAAAASPALGEPVRSIPQEITKPPIVPADHHTYSLSRTGTRSYTRKKKNKPGNLIKIAVLSAALIVLAAAAVVYFFVMPRVYLIDQKRPEDQKASADVVPNKASSDSPAVPQEKPEPAIGMTAEEVKNSSWGVPQTINKSTNNSKPSEQWVYGINKYVYLENGIVTAILQ